MHAPICQGQFKGFAALLVGKKAWRGSVKDHFTASLPHFTNSCYEGHWGWGVELWWSVRCLFVWSQMQGLPRLCTQAMQGLWYLAKDMQPSGTAFFSMWHFKKGGQKAPWSLHLWIVCTYHNKKFLRQKHFQTCYLIHWLCWRICVTSIHVGGRSPKYKEENRHFKDTDFTWNKTKKLCCPQQLPNSQHPHKRGLFFSWRVSGP